MTAIEDHHLPDILPAPRETMTDIDKPSEQIAENANCSIDKLAAEKWNAYADKFNQWDALGQDEKDFAIGLILEGMKLQRERDAVIARRYRDDAGGSESYRRACEHIEQAIRSAL